EGLLATRDVPDPLRPPGGHGHAGRRGAAPHDGGRDRGRARRPADEVQEVPPASAARLHTGSPRALPRSLATGGRLRGTLLRLAPWRSDRLPDRAGRVLPAGATARVARAEGHEGRALVRAPPSRSTPH